MNIIRRSAAVAVVASLQLAAATLAPPWALALTNAQIDFINSQSILCSTGPNGDLRIAACTICIQSGQFSGEGLGIFYYDRGITHSALQHYALAIADLDQALRLKPNYALALYARGVIKQEAMGDTAGGAVDIAAAKAIDPSVDQ